MQDARLTDYQQSFITWLYFLTAGRSDAMFFLTINEYNATLATLQVLAMRMRRVASALIVQERDISIIPGSLPDRAGTGQQ